MPKYAPTFVWGDQSRVLRAQCANCSWHAVEVAVPTVRAHLIANRDHAVAMVATVTTILRIEDQDVHYHKPIILGPIGEAIDVSA